MNNVPIRSTIRTTIYYSGMRNLPMEDKLRQVAEQSGGNKAGDWAYMERGFQCLFVFKKESHFDAFKSNLRRDLGMDFNRITISGK